MKEDGDGIKRTKEDKRGRTTEEDESGHRRTEEEDGFMRTYLDGHGQAKTEDYG